MAKKWHKTKKEGNKILSKVYKWRVFLIVSVIILFLCIFLFVWVYGSFGLKGVIFSKKTGFYNNDIDVEIRPDGFLTFRSFDIKYNMNGDDLSTTSEPYVGAIRLEVPEEGYKLYTITAIACKKSGECTTPQIATYILGRDLENDITVDVVSINSSQDNLYNYYTGIMTKGMTYDLNEATEDRGEYIEGNYNNRGKEWMRSAQYTVFDSNRQLIQEEEVLIGISGGTSSAFNPKSLKVLISDSNNKKLDSFRLRSGSQDQFTGNIRSSVMSRLVDESGYDGGTDTKRVVVFLNGKYYGIFDKQRDYSKFNLAQKYSIEKERKIKTYKGLESNVFRESGLQEDIWNDLDLESNREKLEEKVDMDNYLKYFAIQILTNNTDWPMNNFEAWRYGGKNNSGNKYEDGRIRFLIYDTDLIYYTKGNTDWFIGSIGDNFRFLMDNKYRAEGSSFRRVMECDYYRNKFIELLFELLDGPFDTENVLKIIDEEVEKIDHQVKLFNTKEGYDEWVRQIDLMKKAASIREDQVRKDVKKYFGVEL